MHDEINTFTGITKKDLIPGIAEAKIWLTNREQEILEYKIDQIGFSEYPESIPAQDGMMLQPDMGDQFIRIKFKGKDKTVTWREPVSRTFKQMGLLLELQRLILDIVESKSEYKALPPRKGGYL